MIRKLLVSALCLSSSLAWAGTAEDIENAKAAVNRDLAKLAGWAAPEFAKGFGFAAAQGSNLPVPGLSLLKSPRVELGVLGGASLTPVDITGLRALNTEVFKTADIDIPASLPLPAAGIHAKVGAVLGLDGGFRYMSTPKLSVSAGGGKVEAEQTQWGISVRKTFFGGALPFVTAGLAYDALKTDVSYSLTNTFKNSSSYSGIAYTETDKVTQTYKVNADMNVTSLHVLAGKSLGIILPTLGASLNMPGGNSTVTLEASDEITLADAAGLAAPVTKTVTLSGASTAKAKTDFRVQAGLEFNLLIVRLGVLGEYGLSSKVAGASAGLRLQF